MFVPVNSIYQTEIQIYNRVFFLIIAGLPFLKNRSFKLKIPVSFSFLIAFLLVSIVPTIFGKIVFGDEGGSIKPISYLLVFLLSLSIPTNKQIIDQLIKLFIIFFSFEFLFLLITGYKSSFIEDFYIWRFLPVLNIYIPRLYGPMIDTHTSWTLLSYLILLKLLFEEKKNYLNLSFLGILSFNFQVALQNFLTTFFGLPNSKKSFFLNNLKYLRSNKLNYFFLYILLFFSLLIFLISNIGYLDPNNQFSISYAFLQLINYKEFIKPLINDNSIICPLVGCAVKVKFFMEFSKDLNIYYFFSDIGLFRVLYEYGIIYILLLFFIMKKLLQTTVVMFVFFGLIHYPVVFGIPFAFYIPYLYRCAKARINTV